MKSSENTKFEKVSLNEWKRSNENEEELDILTQFDSIQLPRRATKNSAGYDFYAPHSLKIKGGEIGVINTGVKCKLHSNQVLMLFPRSSVGIQSGIMLANSTGIIDSDYYNNEKNEGHISIALRNLSKKNFNVKKGDRIAQGIILEYGITDGDKSNTVRTGGIGSTGK